MLVLEYCFHLFASGASENSFHIYSQIRIYSQQHAIVGHSNLKHNSRCSLSVQSRGPFFSEFFHSIYKEPGRKNSCAVTQVGFKAKLLSQPAVPYTCIYLLINSSFSDIQAAWSKLKRHFTNPYLFKTLRKAQTKCPFLLLNLFKYVFCLCSPLGMLVSPKQ